MNFSGIPEARLVRVRLGTGFRFVRDLDRERGFSILPRLAMELIIFTVLALLACLFLGYVLLQWLRDADRKSAHCEPNGWPTREFARALISGQHV